MTKTTKIVLAAAAALLIALLGAYLWIEYGGSDDSERGLTVEEQSPVIHADSAADAADDSSAETESSADSKAPQTPEAEEAADNGGAEDTATASPDASASANAPDEFSTQLQEGIQEFVDYAAKIRAQVPEMAAYADMTLAFVEGLAELDAQLREQGASLEERREKLLMKSIRNSMGSAGSVAAGFASMTQDPERMMELSQSIQNIEQPTKLTTLLQGDMTDEQMVEKMKATPEYQAMMEEMRQSFEGLDLSEPIENPFEDP
ncbi:MAG: hypothetical protein OXT69_09750 [Candidatus Poribacteria bacterium]|nr:hypothetical protein [Candidatus Poribacteria bacterium]